MKTARERAEELLDKFEEAAHSYREYAISETHKAYNEAREELIDMLETCEAL